MPLTLISICSYPEGPPSSNPTFQSSNPSPKVRTLARSTDEHQDGQPYIIIYIHILYNNLRITFYIYIYIYISVYAPHSYQHMLVP